ncbi:Retrovirus-related Pol polyprotein from type-1 retrotransposable element R1 [Eumeta japonica]|uniref:Retrovirus-related Pol polyprotein from type-1 retrotransposable element R1 n=1 Tax=Eumeta variegata TaxID=151549 RepID=A0A4C1SEK7_EUMVA|nr:Retrovirus-related Pol polyprotein from type-1 retrotransposable element R1 [Eumeta japonica]
MASTVKQEQVNLGRSVATRELPDTDRCMGLDQVLVQKQYTRVPFLLQNGLESKAGVMLAKEDKRTIAVLLRLSGPVHISSVDVYMVSSYFQYRVEIDLHLDYLERVLKVLHGQQILIRVDCNAHSPLWFCKQSQYIGCGTKVEHRTHRMESCICGHGLIIHNTEGQPTTFSGPGGESNIDLTLITRIVTITEWQVQVHQFQ